MANISHVLDRGALVIAIGAMALLVGCESWPWAGTQTWERTTWAGTLNLPAQAVKGGTVIYLEVDLGEFLSPKTHRIKMPLPEGGSLLIEKTDEANRDSRQLVWKGKIKGDSSSTATFATSNGFLAGNILTSTGKMYRVDQVAPGIQVLFEVDRSLFPAEAQPLYAPRPVGPPPRRARSSGACPDDNAQHIEVMFVYTSAACAASDVSSTSNTCTPDAELKIKNYILTITEETSTAFAESQATPRISRAHSRFLGEYAETNDLGDELARLRQDEMDDNGTPAAVFDDVQLWRNQYRADIVSLVTKPAGTIADGSACGVSTLMGDNKSWFEKYAFMVVPLDCMNLNQSFTHELGHLMGAGHEPPTPSQLTVFHDNNRAHVQLNPSSKGTFAWRTVMAENSTACTDRRAKIGCDRILRFSNPSVDYLGDPTGSSTENNSAVVSETAETVARFRTALSCDNP